MKQWFLAIAMLAVMSLNGQGEGGVFTAQRLGAIKTGEGALGNNPSALNWFNDVRNKAAKLGTLTTLGIEDIEGSVYLDERFIMGDIYYRYTPYGSFALRYDGFNDEVELKRTPTSEIEALHKNEAISCTIAGEHFYYLKYKDAKHVVNTGYLTLLFTGENYTLYIRRSKLFKEGKPAKTSLQSSFPPRFVEDVQYFLKHGEEMPLQLKTTKKAITALVTTGKKLPLKEFVKRNKISLNNQNDLVRTIQFIDQLPD